MAVKWRVVLLLGSCLSLVSGANILALFTMVSRSHHIWTSSLSVALARSGHNVTVLGTMPLKKAHPNLTSIVLDGIYEYTQGHEDYDLENMSEVPPADIVALMLSFGKDLCHYYLQHKAVQTLLNYPDDFKFDLVIYEPLSGECLLGITSKFGSPPLVGVEGFSHPMWVDYRVGNPNNPAYIPHIMLPYSDHMTFLQRAHNLWFTLWADHHWHANNMPALDEISRQYLGSSAAVPSQEARRLSILMVNTHPSFDHPRPLLPSVINVAGLHIKEPHPLPQDLKLFLDDAKEGAIFFSLGSNLQSRKLKEEKRLAILTAFAELPYKVLWKWEDDSLPGQPKNVKVGKWLPQTDILAHPNVRLFITHSGLLSTQEAIYRGVPMVGIPFFADQQINIGKVQRQGVGVRLDYKDLTKESLLRAIHTVLDDPSYAQKMRQLSARFRDQPDSALQRAVFWCEYVIRHKGALHLRSAAMDLAWYQYLLLDVVLFLVVATCLPLGLLCYCCRRMCSRRRPHHKVKNN